VINSSHSWPLYVRARVRRRREKHTEGTDALHKQHLDLHRISALVLGRVFVVRLLLHGTISRRGAFPALLSLSFWVQLFNE